MEYGRGQTCGHTSRKVTVEIVESENFGIIADSVREHPTCTFFFQFGFPYSLDVLLVDVINKNLGGNGMYTYCIY
jgi:hypothetical protein